MCAERPGERPPCDRPLEAAALAARPRAAAGSGAAPDEDAVPRREAHELGLRPDAAAADAAAVRAGYSDSSSTGMPAGTSSSGASSGCSPGAAASGVSSGSSASGSPPTRSEPVPSSA